MKLLFILMLLCAFAFYCRAQNKKESFLPYTGSDLGLIWSPKQSIFRIWAPTASKTQLKLYNQSFGGEPLQTIGLTKSKQGT